MQLKTGLLQFKDGSRYILNVISDLKEKLKHLKFNQNKI
jgi:hypothetical protein